MSIYYNHYLHKWTIPKISSNAKPILSAWFPKFLWAVLPINKPRKVNEELVIANIVDGNMEYFMMLVKPIPVIKASILTNTDNKII